MSDELFWFQVAVCSVQVAVLGLTYALLRLIQEYLKDFGYKAGFTKEHP